MVIKKVDILQSLFERLIQVMENDYTNTLVLGLASQSGGLQNPIAITIINYTGEQSLELAVATLPSDLSLIGIVAFGNNNNKEEVYTILAKVRDAFLLKVTDGKISATTGLEYNQMLNLNVVTPEQFWGKTVCTFRIRGKFLIDCILEYPDLKKCFDKAKERVFNQAAYTVGKKSDITLLPRWGHIVSKIPQVIKPTAKVTDIMNGLKHDIAENKDSNNLYFCPTMSLINVKLKQDQSKSIMTNNSAALIVSDKTARCKLFMNYVDIDALVIVPRCMKRDMLYRKFNIAVSSQLQFGFYSNMVLQLGNSILVENPKVYHFWPWFSQHFLTLMYPQNTSTQQLKDEYQNLFFTNATRPLFPRLVSLFQPVVGLISPHVNLKGKFSDTEIISGPYEYRHYMQEDFDDEGWGCAYRSLQTIVSWFRFQGFTSTNVPTHREIQECLVSLGDKPPSFIGSRQWIGSMEVSLVVKALLGVECDVSLMDDGTMMTQMVPNFLSHFKSGGAPVLIGKGDAAYTLIGISHDPNSDRAIFLICDPHYTGTDDTETVLLSEVVGWKESSFWENSVVQVCRPARSAVPNTFLTSNFRGEDGKTLGRTPATHTMAMYRLSEHSLNITRQAKYFC